MRSNKLLIIILVTIFFIVLMTSFAFPDLFAMFYVPNMLKDGNVYTLVRENKNICPWLSATYPPLYFLVTGFYLQVIKFIGFLNESLFKINSCPVFELILNKAFLFWVKLPFLVLHFCCAWIFSKFFKKNNFLWFLFWLLNPIAIFVNFIEGQYEIMPTFFMLLALFFAKDKKMQLSALCLGIGGALKHFPFLWVMPFLIILTDNFLDRIKFIALSVMPYIVSMLFFFNQDFLNNIIFVENFKMFDLGYTLGNLKISVYIVVYIFLIFLLLQEKEKGFNILIKYCFLFSVIFFVSSFWSPQRLLFLMPTMLIFASREEKMLNKLPLLYHSYFFYIFVLYPGLFDHTLLRPIIPRIKPINYEWIFTPFIKQVVFSCMIGVIVWFIYSGFRNKLTKEYAIGKKQIIIPLISLFTYFFILMLLVIISGFN